MIAHTEGKQCAQSEICPLIKQQTSILLESTALEAMLISADEHQQFRGSCGSLLTPCLFLAGKVVIAGDLLLTCWLCKRIKDTKLIMVSQHC